VEAGMVLCKSDAQNGTPGVQDVERAAVQGLVDAYETRRFTETVPELKASA
jgi:sigma-B regulation protein RsbU (phosphoserine phosphatase)